jgi:hypothetical protein
MLLSDLHQGATPVTPPTHWAETRVYIVRVDSLPQRAVPRKSLRAQRNQHKILPIQTTDTVLQKLICLSCWLKISAIYIGLSLEATYGDITFKNPQENPKRIHV